MARVGLLEDNARIAKLCATILQFAGHSVEIYEHPQKCLNALMLPIMKSEGKAQSRLATPSTLPIEVLILDLQLPEITGIEVLQQLQSQPQTRTLPLIFCTAANASDVARALRVAPHASVVEKPFKLDVLVSTVLSALGTKNRS
ncbi:MAG: hypothetical protein NVS4B11_17050 [Ktedonobacteraceae bacterium]